MSKKNIISIVCVASMIITVSYNYFSASILERIMYISGVLFSLWLTDLLVLRKTLMGTVVVTVLTFFVLMGNAYYLFGSITGMFYEPLLTVAAFVSVYSIVNFIVLSIWKTIEMKFEKKDDSSYLLFFDKHLYLIALSAISIVSIVYIIIFYPGSVHWDGLAQLNNFMGISWWDNQYPALSTMLMGNLFNLGKTIANDNFGIFLYTFTQSIVSALILSYGIVFLKQMKAPRIVIVASIVYFALLPIWPMNGYTLFKETYYYLGFSLFFIQLCKMLILKIKFDFINCILFIVASLMMLSTRSEAFYVLVGSFFIALLYNIKNQTRTFWFLFLVGTLGFNLVYHKVFLPANGIAEGSVRETLSVMIQQSARYEKEHPEDYTAKERDDLQSVLYIDHELIGDLYVPEHADDVKFQFLYRPTDEQLNNYITLWFNQFLKHPMTYVESYLNNYYGYLSPLRKEFKDGHAWYSIQNSEMVNQGQFNIYMNVQTEKTRNFIIRTNTGIRNLPIVEFIYNTGTYFWFFMIGLLAIIKTKEWAKLVVCTPIIFTLLFVFLSPVNALIRYMLPIMAIIFIYISLLLIKIDE